MQWYRQWLDAPQVSRSQDVTAKTNQTNQATKMKMNVRLVNAASCENAMKRVVAEYTVSCKRAAAKGTELEGKPCRGY